MDWKEVLRRRLATPNTRPNIKSVLVSNSCLSRIIIDRHIVNFSGQLSVLILLEKFSSFLQQH
ncbi:hypothetical protein H8959_015265 [Pygathrix nigripes]